MRLLLDTSAMIENMHGNADVRDRIEESDSANISPISFFEVLIGLPENERFRVLNSFSGFPILPFTSRDSTRASRIYLKLKEKGKMVKVLDILVAAQAAERNLVLLAKDKDFDIITGVDSGVSVIQIKK